MKEIFAFIKPHRGRLIIVALCHVLSTVASLLMPYAMSRIVDGGIRVGNIDTVIVSSVVMGGLALASLLTSLISNRINAHVTTAFSTSVMRAVYKKTNSLSVGQYSRIGSSGLLTRSTDDVFNIEGMASELVYTLVTVPMMLIGGAVLAFLSDWVLALIFILFIPPVLIFVSILVRPLYRMWDNADKYIDVQNRIVRERLSGLRVVRAFNNEAREHARAKDATENMAKYIIKSNVRSGYITPVALLLLNIATVVMLYLGSVRADAGIITDAGGVIATIQYVTLAANAVLSLSWTIAWIPHLRVSVKRIGEVLNLPTEDEGADSEVSECPIREGGAAIELNAVSFTYPDSQTPVLQDINLFAKEGERVAIIGGTGSGKTTLVRLLLDFYSPDCGQRLVGGRDYKDMTKSEIRSYYSTALQRGMIFEGTLRDNIAMGKEDATDGEIFSVAQDCALSEFIASKKEGLDFLLVGMGQNVSGGQKQRINMSRAVLRVAPVYIFDDSFSALDYLTERKIQDALSERLKGRTRIFVTQRVSTALACERIYVMDRGRIVGEGTHRELISSCDTYREICISQLGRAAVTGGDE